MINRILNYSYGLFMVLLMVFITGCLKGGPVPISGFNDTFGLPEGIKDCSWVYSVTVGECDDKGLIQNLVWEIRTDKKCQDKTFRVTAGIVPEDFYQIVPKPPENFFPQKGVTYKIYMLPKYPPTDIIPRGTTWHCKE